MQEKKFDLVIVGTGFASSFFLKKYLEKSNSKVKVLVLEKGYLFPHSERLKQKQGHSIDPIFEEQEPNKNFTQKNKSKTWAIEPNFGGCSNCWTGCTPRFMPADFLLKSNYGVGEDWPIGYSDIADYYEEAEQALLISGPEITPFPKHKKYPLPAHALSSVDKLLQKEYGMLYISQPSARASVGNNLRGSCCSSGVCDVCPANAKSTIENTLLSIYHDPRVTIEYGAEVSHMETSLDGIKSIVYKKGGKTLVVEAELFALGANAIFNASILLKSGDKNLHTGKGICEQVGKFINVYFKNLDNLGGGSIISANGYMMYDGAHRKSQAACLIENFNAPLIIRNEVGKWRKIARFKFVYEDLPQMENHISVNTETGIPKINYDKHSDYLQRGLDNLEQDFLKYFSFLPIDRYEIDSNVQKTEYHICSTTSMSVEANDGVVDKNMIHHQFRNLFVLGSSVFPSISPANPSLTIAALSLRAADINF